MLEVLAILAVWRITFLLHYEEGPYHILGDLRNFSRHHTQVLDCFFCSSVWVALPFALIFNYWIIHWLAFSAGAMIIDGIMDRLQA